MNFLMPGYVPPVDKNVKVPESVTDHNQIRSTEDLYQLRAEDVKKNLKSLDDKVGDNKLDGPDQVEISGPDQLEVDQVETYYAAHQGDYVKSNDGQIVWLSEDGVNWGTGLIQVVEPDGKFWVKGRNVGNVTINNLSDSSDPPKDITVVEAGPPITLQKFDIEVVDDKYPHLTWTTASETNNDYFAIERSFDGRSFDEIARVKSKAENGMSRGL